MGTRCNIVLECGDQIKYIYRHYDGYPSSVKPELKKYVEAIRWYADNYKEFVKQGDEQLAPHTNEGIKKLFAEPSRLLEFYADLLVKHEAWDGVRKILNPMYKQTHYEPMQLTGKYETTNSIHGDIDWLYTITIDESTHKVRSLGYSRPSYHNPYAMLESAWQGVWNIVTSKPESKLWYKLREGTQDLGVFWTRLESWATPGIPDLHGILNGQAFWLELKVHRLKSLKNIALRPHQIAWQTRYFMNKGKVYNLVHHPSSSTLNIFGGGRAIKMGEAKVSEPLIPDWSCESPFDWHGVIDHILSSSDRHDKDDYDGEITTERWWLTMIDYDRERTIDYDRETMIDDDWSWSKAKSTLIMDDRYWSGPIKNWWEQIVQSKTTFDYCYRLYNNHC